MLDVKGGMTRDKGYGSVKKRFDELLNRGHLSLLLNLSHVPYMNSASVGELASSCITVSNRRAKLTIAASLSSVMELLATSKLDTVVEVFDTEAEVLQSFDR